MVLHWSGKRNGFLRGFCTATWVVCAIVLGGCFRGSDDADKSASGPALSVPAPSKLEAATKMHEQGDSAGALKLVQEILISSPDDFEANLLALDIHDALGQYCEVAQLATAIADHPNAKGAELLFHAFDRFLRCGDHAAAEASLRRAVEVAPRLPGGHRLLAQLLNAQGRRYEASEHVRELIRMKVVQPNELLSLIDLQGPFSLASFDQLIDPSEITLFTLGQARHLYVGTNADPGKTIDLLDRVTEKFPENTAASAFLGRVLAESNRYERFDKWRENLPPGIEKQPEYWHALGLWLAHDDRHDEAIRAFGEAVHRDPTDRGSLREIIRSLGILGEEEQVSKLRERLADLDMIFRIAKDADAQQAIFISNAFQQFVRPWESAAWRMYAAQLNGELQQRIPELNQRAAAIAAWEKDATAEQIRNARTERMLGFKVERWPMPDLESAIASAPIAPIVGQETGLRLDDVASTAGLVAQFESGFPLDGSEFYPYQANGGGLAAFDFDLDGRCDIYVMQSGGKPNDPSGSAPNQLFRLLPGQQYADVGRLSQSDDRSFGQGVCAGDVNQDGFPDLLVANIGANVVYINQGDGTFREASELIQNNPDEWTSMLGLGDLDGDHLPEIVEVNYIDDPQAYILTCQRNYLECQPQQFRKAADRLHHGNVDGTFSTWESVPEIRDDPKLGFGLVIANFDREFGNDFFVPNDGDFNHYWMSVAASDSNAGKYSLVQAAGLRGCSVGRNGRSQACMGVASGDFNRDGTLDMHITNFRQQPVNLFMQTRSGFFTDEASKYGLAEPSFGVLGFGTQAADFDNDGWLDLAVTNGHVFDARFEDIPFAMPPQLFRGNSRGFTSQSSESAGRYWQQSYVGRAMAMLDWNRDGRVDLVTNHLDRPVALLQNDSPAQNWIEFELVGVTSERDAIGAEVRVTAGEDQWTAWQTGGDGYMCTNEQIVHVGVGQIQTIDRVEVRWPGGQTQTFSDLAINRRVLIVESDPELFPRD